MKTNGRLIVGLTGPSGAGKSTAVECFRQRGFDCIDCDAISRAVYDTNPLCVEAVGKTFGASVLTQGKINRRALAAAAFRDEEQRERLNGAVLPYIAEEVLRRLEQSQSAFVLLDAPTLYESGLNEICGAVMALLCDRALCRTRIIARDALSEMEADCRLSVGQPDEFYRERTDYVVYNNGTKEELAQAVSAMLAVLLEEREA